MKQLSSMTRFFFSLRYLIHIWFVDSSSLDAESATVSNRSTIKSPKISNEKVIIQTDKFIQYLVEKLPEILLKLQISPSSHTIEESTEQRQRIASNLLRDYLQTTCQVQASTTEIIDKQNDRKSYSFFCSTSANT